jgi:L-cysteine S-thiosulfotransferase
MRSLAALATAFALPVGAIPATAAMFATTVTAQTTKYTVVDDGIPVALTAQPGDASRGRDIVTNRQVGMCQLCHQVPASNDRFQGDIATDLAGAGARWTVPQLRLRIVDSRRLNAESVMPAYYKTQNLKRVGANWRDKPILNAQQVEDVVAWLTSLK